MTDEYWQPSTVAVSKETDNHEAPQDKIQTKAHRQHSGLWKLSAWGSDTWGAGVKKRFEVRSGNISCCNTLGERTGRYCQFIFLSSSAGLITGFPIGRRKRLQSMRFTRSGGVASFFFRADRLWGHPCATTLHVDPSVPQENVHMNVRCYESSLDKAMGVERATWEASYDTCAA